MDLLDNHPELARSLIRSLVHMVRRLTKNVESLALKDVYCRIVDVLERRSVAKTMFMLSTSASHTSLSPI